MLSVIWSSHDMARTNLPCGKLPFIAIFLIFENGLFTINPYCENATASLHLLLTWLQNLFYNMKNQELSVSDHYLNWKIIGN